MREIGSQHPFYEKLTFVEDEFAVLFPQSVQLVGLANAMFDEARNSRNMTANWLLARVRFCK